MKRDCFSYPIRLKVKNRLCVVVGGGMVAYRKVQGLVEQGAKVRVLSPVCVNPLKELAKQGVITWQATDYDRSGVDSAFLVFAATNDEKLNRQILEEAPCLASSATNPEEGDFSLPAQFTKGELSFTIATGGHAGYTRLLKEWLQRQIPEEASQILPYLQQVREQLLQTDSTPKERTEFWRTVLTDEWMTLLEEHKLEEAREQIEDAVNRFGTQSSDRTC